MFCGSRRRINTQWIWPIGAAALFMAAGCGDDGGGGDGGNGGDDGGTLQVPSTYSYDSRFRAGSSLAYSGQIFRQVLISDLEAQIGDLTERIDTGALTPVAGDVVAELNFYYLFDGDTSGGVEHGISTTPPTTQTTYGDISGGPTLQGKVAGNDAVGQHQDWATAFVGWDDAAVTTPDSLVLYWFQQIETLAIDRSNGTIPLEPDGTTPISKVFVTELGQDYQQLVQTFLVGAVAFSQGTDDYLDDDIDGKGLRSDNTAQDGDTGWTVLERAWDEAFGYFGAARDYGNYTDDEIAGEGGRDGYSNGYYDSDGSGTIDLLSEFNFDYAVNAAKRDRSSSATATTDFTADAWGAFLTGRAIIAASDTLSDTQMRDLQDQRDIAVRAWENTIAATAVHYINVVLQEMGKFGTVDYSFSNHAQQWSQLKGVALSFQFNPRSSLTAAQFADLHTKIGQAPVLPNRPQPDIDAYRAALLAARDILKSAYGFADANMGDNGGNGAW